MKRSEFWLSVFVAILSSISQVVADDYSLEFPADEGRFGVIDGVPYLLRKGESGPAANALDVIKGGKLRHLASDKLLCYPQSGDDTRITLADAKAKGIMWDIARKEQKSGIPIRAQEGKFSGWYLDWSEKEEELKFQGATIHGRRLILVKEKNTPRKFRTYSVSK